MPNNNSSIFRNVNIITELNAQSSNQFIDIYTPGTINPYDVVAGVKYSGFITSLRLTVNIKSIKKLILPDSSDLETEEVRRLREREAINNTPRKCLSLYLRNSSDRPALLGDVLVFNREPYYFIPLIKYFSDSNTFDCAPDTVISVQMKEVGYGLLQNKDTLTIIGSVVEESPYVNASNNTFPTSYQPDSSFSNESTIGN